MFWHSTRDAMFGVHAVPKSRAKLGEERFTKRAFRFLPVSLEAT